MKYHYSVYLRQCFIYVLIVNLMLKADNESALINKTTDH